MTLSYSSLMMFALVAIAETTRDEAKNAAVMELEHGQQSHVRECPYGSDEDSRIGGDSSFNCHGYASGEGTTCPALQVERLKTAKAFQFKHHASFLKRVGGYPLSPLFDKSKDIRGDETYEELLHLHIKGLANNETTSEMEALEDKIYLKQKAKKLGIPTTAMHYGAHVGEEWKRDKFNQALVDLCNRNVDDFFIKATHLAWSQGQKIVKDFQKDCKSNISKVQEEFANFIETEILNRKASDADEHLQKLSPGVTVESLFKTGGKSIKPLEAKVQVLWGKMHHMFFFGMDDRGCRVNVGTWQIYGDKTGWDLSGIIQPGGGNDALGDRLLKEAFQPMVNYAERFARSVEADLMRVDFFLAPDPNGKGWKIEMNECESVTGMQHTYERQGLGAIWRDGYIMSDRLAMNPEKYKQIRANVVKDRTKLNLD
jgi:hypothetical protein